LKVKEASLEWSDPIRHSIAVNVRTLKLCQINLRSAASHQLVVPSYRLSSYGRRAFSVAGPTTLHDVIV